MVDGVDRSAGPDRHARRARSPSTPACPLAFCRKLVRCRPTTCAISGRMTRWWKRKSIRRPGPRRWPRSSEQLLGMYADPALDRKPELLGQRGGAFYSEAAVALLASLVGDTGDTQVVNVRNAGTLPFLADDAVIEVPAVIGAHGASPVPVAPLSPLMCGLVGHVSAYEELAVDAARQGGVQRVRDALLAHPLIGQYELAGPAGGPAGGGEPGLPALGPRLMSQAAAAAARGPGHRRREQQDGGRAGGRGRDRAVPAARPGQQLADHRPGPGAAGARRPGRRGSPGGSRTTAFPVAGAGVRLPGRRRPAGRGGGTRRAGPAPRAGPRRPSVVNDTFAVLRAGLDQPGRAALGRRGHRGAGINCVGVTPDGRTTRFLSLGPISGDWGGGGDLGRGRSGWPPGLRTAAVRTPRCAPRCPGTSGWPRCAT